MLQRLYVFLTMLSFLTIYGQNTDELKKMLDTTINLKYKNDSLSKQYILNSENLPYNLSDEMKSKGLETINIYDRKNKKILKSGIKVWKIISFLNKNQLEIRIIDFAVQQKNNNYNFSNSGGSTFIYEYSCDLGDWKLVSENHSGI